jgi:signal-transduction protein with cAMP-binding, CBS, and nucleotidyltransferase domain
MPSSQGNDGWASKFNLVMKQIRLEFQRERTDKSIKPMKIPYPVSSVLSQKQSETLWCVAPETTVFNAIGLMAKHNIGALPVQTADGRLVGIFTERDYTRKVALQGKSSKETRVSEILTKDLVTVTPEDTVEDCMRRMTENRVRHLPVVADGKLTGIVSIGDLVNWIISTQNAAIEQMEQYIAGGAAG